MLIFFPPNCGEVQVSPVVELTKYYSYCYRDGPLTEADPLGLCQSFLVARLML